MAFTINELFDALHYCNKVVKLDEFKNYEAKREFYNMKRDLLYHIIKNHRLLGVSITECFIDLQPSNVQEGTMNRLYAFCLTYEGTELKVHQREYSKLTQLLDVLKIRFAEGKDYCPDSNEDVIWNEEAWNKTIHIIKVFYHNEWHLDELIRNLCDKANAISDIFDSFVYYFPDFKFTLERKGALIGVNTVVQVKHINSGRTYRITLGMLRAKGELMLPIWRKQHKIFKVCIQ